MVAFGLLWLPSLVRIAYHCQTGLYPCFKSNHALWKARHSDIIGVASYVYGNPYMAYNENAIVATGNEDVIERKHGTVTGKDYYRVAGVDMAWAGSESEARDIAARVRTWFASYREREK